MSAWQSQFFSGPLARWAFLGGVMSPLFAALGWLTRQQKKNRLRAELAESLLAHLRSEKANDYFVDLKHTGLRPGSHDKWWRRIELRRGSLGLSRALARTGPRFLVVEGEAGTGKTTSLQHAAAHQLRRRYRFKFANPPFAFYIPLAALTEHTEASLLEYIKQQLSARVGRQELLAWLDGNLERELADRRTVLLLDGFDEIPAIARARQDDATVPAYLEGFRNFSNRYPRARIVLATRTYRGQALLNEKLVLQELDWRQVLLRIRRADLDESLRRLLSNALEDPKRSTLRNAATNVLMLTLIIEHVRRHRTVPNNAHAAMESYVTGQLSRKADLKPQQLQKHRRLGQLVAFALIAQPDARTTVTARDISLALTTSGNTVRPADLNACLDLLVGVRLMRATPIQDSSSTKLEFSHRRILEYLAVCHLQDHPDAIKPKDLLTLGQWRDIAVSLLQLQSGDSNDRLLTCAGALLSDLLPQVEEDSSGYWPDGCRHLLSILDTGFAEDRKPVQEAATKILRRAMSSSSVLDQKWALDVAGAATEEARIDFIARGYGTGSAVLARSAYRQTYRVSALPRDLEPLIARTLLSMSVGGELRTRWRELRARFILLGSNRLGRLITQLVMAPFIDLLVHLIALWFVYRILAAPNLLDMLVAALLLAVSHMSFYWFRAMPSLTPLAGGVAGSLRDSLLSHLRIIDFDVIGIAGVLSTRGLVLLVLALYALLFEGPERILAALLCLLLMWPPLVLLGARWTRMDTAFTWLLPVIPGDLRGWIAGLFRQWRPLLLAVVLYVGFLYSLSAADGISATVAVSILVATGFAALTTLAFTCRNYVRLFQDWRYIDSALVSGGRMDADSFLASASRLRSSSSLQRFLVVMRDRQVRLTEEGWEAARDLLNAGSHLYVARREKRATWPLISGKRSRVRGRALALLLGPSPEAADPWPKFSGETFARWLDEDVRLREARTVRIIASPPALDGLLTVLEEQGAGARR